MAVIVSIFAAVFVTVVSHQANAASAEDFYNGKTIRVVVGFAAGGGFDSYARILARHMPRHTPGNPALIVDNMAGAGSRLAANYLYKASAPDGLTIGNFIGSLIMQQVLGDQSVEFDGRKFEWLGAPVTDETACAITTASGVTNMDEWLTAKKPVKLGGEALGAEIEANVRKLFQLDSGIVMKLKEIL